jgi:23S rRNA (adenine2503-C2)-methyltransferase
MKLVNSVASADGSVKHLWCVAEQIFVESIRFQYGDGRHICISSQAGCPVACVFCETGRVRRNRNLTAEQIVHQVAATRRELPGHESRYAVVQFAGMGEPLFNFAAVAAATDELLDRGLTDAVTLTTSGIVPRIKELARTRVERLNVSLHATDNATRTTLMPINRRFPIDELIAASTDYKLETGHRVTMNYLLFDGVNDSDADLDRLVHLLDPALFSVKLKAWNEIAATDLRISPPGKFAKFVDALDTEGFDVTICESVGQDVAGGCGQLSADHAAARFDQAPSPTAVVC